MTKRNKWGVLFNIKNPFKNLFKIYIDEPDLELLKLP